MSWKSALRLLVPPLLTSWYQKARAARGFRGRYRSWKDAREVSSGYASDSVVAAVRRTVHELRGSARVVDGRNAGRIDPKANPFLLLCILLRQAAQDRGVLRVLDFGGGLGTTYFICKPMLEGLKEVSWHIVEQESHARVGREEFADANLRFFSSLAEHQASGSAPVNVLLLSSVLQYLEDPLDQVRALLEARPATVIIDRTPFSRTNEGFLTVQEVPSHIYRASYPCWVLSRDELLSVFARDYELVTEFRSHDELDPSAECLGFYFKRKNH